MIPPAAAQSIEREIVRVDTKRGFDLATPDGTGPQWATARDIAQAEYDSAEARGEATFALALREEVLEALAETNPRALRAELVQVAGVAIRWIRAIDAR